MLLTLDFLKKRKLYLYSIPLLILLLMLVWALLLLNQKTIYKGVHVDGLDISGLEPGQASRILKQRVEDKYGWKKIVLKYEKNAYEFSQKEISYRFLIDRSMEKAYRIGRSGNLLNRLNQILSVRFKPVDINLEIQYDEKKLRSILSNLKQQIDKKEKNAAVIYKKGNITLNKDEIGKNLKIDNNIFLVDNQVRDGNFTITLHVDDVVPRVTYDKISGINGVLASFSTVFNPRDTNRSYNIVLACERINGTILFPGEIFSMHKALGPRTLENGYREAPVIYKNELVQGTGGGVCQVTTTLYNAVLLSGIEVLERTHHSIPLGYVNPGQDATIAEDYIDFKFQNSAASPVCISAEVVGNTLDVRILGNKKPEPYVVKLRPEILEQYPPDGEELIVDNNLADNEKVMVREAKNGLKVVLYRETFDTSGQMVLREKISEDVYNPVSAQYKVNRKTHDELRGKTTSQ